jgi:hypothetical protein
MWENVTTAIPDRPKDHRNITEAFTNEARVEAANHEVLRDQRDRFIRNLFTYHAPRPDQAQKYQLINNLSELLAKALFDNCPQGGEFDLALIKLREFRMWANASIAIRG